MSILSDLLNKKITFSEAATEAEQWAAKIVASDSSLTTAVGTVTADLKQAASNAVALAGTALGALIAPAAATVEAAANELLTKAIGAGATTITPAVDNAITTGANALKAEIDAAETALRAKLAGPTS